MAFGPKEGVGINLKFPLHSRDRGFFETNKTTLAAVREDIKILLLTKKGERVINPEIGTNLITSAEMFKKTILFENADKQTFKMKAENEIVEALNAHMPHVKLTSLNVIMSDEPGGESLDNNMILIKMTYALLSAEALTDSVQFKI